MATQFHLNGKAVTVDVPDETPLLWVIRDELNHKGTKFGCGIGLCGACTVHINGVAQRSCITSVSLVSDTQVTTIEGLNHRLQQSWIDAQAPQCGYCQSGQIMQAASLLNQNPKPSDEEIVAAMEGNLCRCMAYTRIKKAIKLAVASGEEANEPGYHNAIQEIQNEGAQKAAEEAPLEPGIDAQSEMFSGAPS